MTKTIKYHPKRDPKFTIVYNRNRTRFILGAEDTFEKACKRVEVYKESTPQGITGVSS